MKTYESARLVELGDANDLVLGNEGMPLDSLPDDITRQFIATFVDIDE